MENYICKTACIHNTLRRTVYGFIDPCKWQQQNCGHLGHMPFVSEESIALI